MKVLVLEFHQESNSFCPVYSCMEDYKRCSYLEGEAFIRELEGKALAANGMFQVLKEAGAEIIPGIGMRSPAGGTVEHSVFTHFMEKAGKYIDGNLPLDGVLVSLHGATQTTEDDDACGAILEMIRSKVGEKTVISASFDLHANITEKMYRNSNIICGYQTYPHVDVYETGVRAARLAVRLMKGETDLYCARALIPMIAPASGYNTSSGPLADIVKEAEAMVAGGQLEDFTIFHMQPWLDVYEGMGVVLAISKDEAMAASCAEKLARQVYDIRESMNPDLDSIDEVLDRAEQVQGDRPLVVVDFSDSTNAGAAGDNAYIVQRLIDRGNRIRAAFVMIDIPAVEAAFVAGVGSEIDITLGGTKDKRASKPVPVHALVRSLSDGNFILEGPSMRGVEAHVGKTAVLSIGNIDVVVCQAMASTGDPQLYRHFGVEPTLYQMVVVKACTSFRVAYTKFALDICYVDTGCAATADLRHLPFSHLTKDIYPFNEATSMDGMPIEVKKAI